jgi:periplasmic copper chaperone A
MKRFGHFIAVAAMFSVIFFAPGAAAAQHDHGHMGTPDASPAAMDHSGHGASTSTGAFYMTITNNGEEADRLISLESDAAGTIEIHDVVMDGTVMQMVPQHDGLEIPAGEQVSLEPGGYHVMMMGLTESLIAGEEFNATLTFEHAGEVEITVPILRTEPDEDALTAGPVEAGDLVIEGIWARHAPKLESDTPAATPAATPES